MLAVMAAAGQCLLLLVAESAGGRSALELHHAAVRCPLVVTSIAIVVVAGVGFEDLLFLHEQVAGGEDLHQFRAADAVTPDLNVAVGRAAEEPVLEGEDHFFVEKTLRSHAAQDHHPFMEVAVMAGGLGGVHANRNGIWIWV